MSTKTYAADQVQVIMGTRRLKGLAEGTFVEIVRDEDTFTKQVGADGEVSRSKTANKSATATITLLQTSEDNAYLQGLHNTDENSGAGIVPFKVIDKSGTTVAIATESWVQKPADISLGRDSGERAWTIALAKVDFSGGGN